MSNHLEWGHALTAQYGYVHAEDAAEVLGEELETGPVALYITTGDGNGVVIEGTRAEIKEFCENMVRHVMVQPLGK